MNVSRNDARYFQDEACDAQVRRLTHEGFWMGRRPDKGEVLGLESGYLHTIPGSATDDLEDPGPVIELHLPSVASLGEWAQ